MVYDFQENRFSYQDVEFCHRVRSRRRRTPYAVYLYQHAESFQQLRRSIALYHWFAQLLRVGFHVSLEPKHLQTQKQTYFHSNIKI